MKIEAILGIILIIIGGALAISYKGDTNILLFISYPLTLIFGGVFISFSKTGTSLIAFGGIINFLANYLFGGCHEHLLTNSCPQSAYVIIFISLTFMLFFSGIIYGIRDGVIIIKKSIKIK